MAAATNRDKCDFFVAPKTRTSARHRVISPTPARILEAPGLEDDFYLNLLDWEPRSNLVTVLLGGGEIYFWKAHSVTSTCSASSGLSSTSNLTTLNRLSQAAGIADRGCVVKWSSSGSSKSTHGSSSLLGGSSANASDSSPLLAVGTRHGCVEVWDPWVQRRVHQWRAHPGARCGVLAWQGTGNGNLLTSGGRDQRLVHYDLRTPQGIVCAVQEHTQEVCGLKWDQHGSGLLASGGNDNQLLVWDPRQLSSTPPPWSQETNQPIPFIESLLQLNQHTAAVKALDWCPHQAGLLASGGGTADRTIRFWNTKTVPGSSAGQTSPVEGFGSEPLSGDAAAFSSSFRHIQASSQVCTLAWSPLTPGEILSTHGFSEHNLCLWSYPSGQLIGTLEGHSHRVLFQALGPDGATVVTGSGDETLRFWNAFKKESGQRSALSRRLNTAADLYLHCR
jgi:cell division cycle 20-like protein 1 (cofactor of APC complex)